MAMRGGIRIKDHSTFAQCKIKTIFVEFWSSGGIFRFEERRTFEMAEYLPPVETGNQREITKRSPVPHRRTICELFEIYSPFEDTTKNCVNLSFEDGFML